jgi:hypothetical protein
VRACLCFLLGVRQAVLGVLFLTDTEKHMNALCWERARVGISVWVERWRLLTTVPPAERISFMTSSIRSSSLLLRLPQNFAASSIQITQYRSPHPSTHLE